MGAVGAGRGMGVGGGVSRTAARGSLDSEVEDQPVSLGGAGNVWGGGSWRGQPPGTRPADPQRWVQGRKELCAVPGAAPVLWRAAFHALWVYVGRPSQVSKELGVAPNRILAFPVLCKSSRSCGQHPGPVSSYATQIRDLG